MPTRNALELFAPFFENLTDPRLERSKRHCLLDIIILAVCATLGNADGWADIERFGKAKLDFFRTLRRMQPDSLDASLQQRQLPGRLR
jgi:hypothetical protein